MPDEPGSTRLSANQLEWTIELGYLLLILFPFLAWLATIASAALLVMLDVAGEIHPQALGLLLGWFLLAAYCQLFGDSALVATTGLVLQTALAIYLIVRWKVSAW